MSNLPRTIVEAGEWDAIRFDKDTMRDVEAGPDGVEYLAFVMDRLGMMPDRGEGS